MSTWQQSPLKDENHSPQTISPTAGSRIFVFCINKRIYKIRTNHTIALPAKGGKRLSRQGLTRRGGQHGTENRITLNLSRSYDNENRFRPVGPTVQTHKLA